MKGQEELYQSAMATKMLWNKAPHAQRLKIISIILETDGSPPAVGPCWRVSWLPVGSEWPLLGGLDCPPRYHSSSSRLAQARSQGGGRAARERAEAAKSLEV